MDQIRILTKELEKASDAYYNTGIEIMSNKEYDEKFDELKKLEDAEGIKDGFTSRVGFQAKGNKLSKVTHEVEAKSLDKTKDVDALVSVQDNPAFQDVCLSWKLDGSTLQATYEGGKLVLAATRGDGITGQNITENITFMTNTGTLSGLPLTIPYEGKIIVRGESLMTYDEFNRLNADGQYANPRNLANATITALDREVLRSRKIVFHAFKLAECDDKDFPVSFGERLDRLEGFGFGVVPHKVLPVSSLKEEIKKWSEDDVIEGLGIPVDGLVVANDNTEFTRNLPGTGHHPNVKEGMAFKWQDETKETTLNRIEWQVGRTGVLTPVAIFDPVELEGTVVSKASLHNLSYILDKDLRIGDRITIYKANMIIPQVDQNLSSDDQRKNFTYQPYHYLAEKPKDMECPCCKSELVIKRSGDVQTINCENEECFAKQVAKFEHAFSKDGLNVEGLSESTIEVLAEKGILKTFSDLYHLKESDFKDGAGNYFEGFGKRSVEKLLDAIENSRNTDPAHFLYACGIPNFGRGQIKLVLNWIRDNLSEEALTDGISNTFEIMKMGLLKDEFTIPYEKIPGIGDVISANVEKFLLDNFKTDSPYAALWKELNVVSDLITERKESLPLTGKTFCITGSLSHFENRDAAFAWIEENGGKTSTSVSAKTSYLVNNDVTSTSGKNKKAKELGIPIISEEQLLSMCKGMEEELEDKEME